MNTRRAYGFTLVEIMIVCAVIGILATILIISYGNWRHHVADTAIQSDVVQATASLRAYNNFHNSFPPNLAGTQFTGSPDSALTLYTDSPVIGVYVGLTSGQNAQLLLNACNANLNGLDNTVCTFVGNGVGAKIHVKGTNSTNTMWPSPIQQSDIVLSCGSACDTATNTMVSQFLAQGGTFPVTVSGGNSALPAPTQIPNGPAANFCLEGRSGTYSDLTYHTTNTQTDIASGPCPNNPSLHYFP